MVDDPLVEITRVYDYTQAEIMRSALQGHGFYCVLFGDNHHSVQPHLGIALGGIRVMVREHQAQEARNFLELAAWDEPAIEQPPALPRSRKGWWRALGSLLTFILGAPMPMRDRIKKDEE
jgi:hypothetical protein